MNVTKGLLAGAIFIAIGASAAFLATDFRIGTIGDMGPGYFPVAIGIIVALIGAVIIAQDLLTHDKTEPMEWMHLRPLVVITLAVVVFGLIIRPMGLVISVAALALIGAFGRRNIRPLETLVTIVILVVIATALFIYGLNLPLNMWPRQWNF